MKNIIFILFGLLLALSSFAQNSTVSVILNGNISCGNFDLILDGTPLNSIGDCEFVLPSIVDGQNYELKIVNSSGSIGLGFSTFDLVLIAQSLLDINSLEPLATYAADIDHDGAVSTYDMIELRNITLFLSSTIDVYHLVKANEVIEDIDQFDIQVDFSSLTFDASDLVSDILEIKVVQLGNIDAHN